MRLHEINLNERNNDKELLEREENAISFSQNLSRNEENKIVRNTNKCVEIAQPLNIINASDNVSTKESGIHSNIDDTHKSNESLGLMDNEEIGSNDSHDHDISSECKLCEENKYVYGALPVSCQLAGPKLSNSVNDINNPCNGYLDHAATPNDVNHVSVMGDPNAHNKSSIVPDRTKSSCMDDSTSTENENYIIASERIVVSSCSSHNAIISHGLPIHDESNLDERNHSDYHMEQAFLSKKNDYMGSMQDSMVCSPVEFDRKSCNDDLAPLVYITGTLYETFI